MKWNSSQIWLLRFLGERGESLQMSPQLVVREGIAAGNVFASNCSKQGDTSSLICLKFWQEGSLGQEVQNWENVIQNYRDKCGSC